MGRRLASNALATYLHFPIRTNKLTQGVINRISAFANGKDCSGSYVATQLGFEISEAK